MVCGEMFAQNGPIGRRFGAEVFFFIVFIQTKGPYGHLDIKMDIFKVTRSTIIQSNVLLIFK